MIYYDIGGFLKWGYPYIIHFLIGIFHYKPTISAGLLFLLDLGRDAHHAGGSDAGEPARTALRADLHVLCTERFRSLVFVGVWITWHGIQTAWKIHWDNPDSLDHWDISRIHMDYPLVDLQKAMDNLAI